MLQLRQSQSLQQRLTPQQVQYLKLLQLPILALEQRIKSELEENPMLEESSDDDEREDQPSDDTPAESMELDDSIEAEHSVPALDDALGVTAPDLSS
jgi:RNA polymerase sigma-54 factor